MINLLLAPVTVLATQGLSKAINLALSKDSVAKKKLHALRDCVLELHIHNLNQSIFVGIKEQKIVVNTYAQQSSVKLSGALIAFIRLASQDDKNALFQSGQIELSGDAVRAQQILQLVESLDIDWEALIADVIGDVPAHAIGSTFKKSWSWTRMVSTNMLRDLEEYVKYELRLFPTRHSARRQFNAIDELRLAADRLEARAKKLINKPKK